MALQKSFEDRAGNSGNYWNIVSIHVVIPDDVMDVRYEVYKDKAAFNAGKAYMDNTSKSITISPIPPAMSGILTAIQTQAKTIRTTDQSEGAIPFFQGATDI